MLLMPLTIKAEEYDVGSANMKITFPDEWYVFTRENIENNSNLENIEVTAEYMNKFFESNSAYIDAIKSNLEFVLRTSEEVDFASLSDYPDEKIEEIASDMGAINQTKDYKVYNGKYRYVLFNSKSGDYYINVYATVINSKWYTFTAQKKSEFTSEEATEIRKIIDSIEYTIVEKEAEPVEEKQEEKPSSSNRIKAIIAYVLLVVACFALVGGLVLKKRKTEE